MSFKYWPGELKEERQANSRTYMYWAGIVALLSDDTGDGVAPAVAVLIASITIIEISGKK